MRENILLTSDFSNLMMLFKWCKWCSYWFSKLAQKQRILPNFHSISPAVAILLSQIIRFGDVHLFYNLLSPSSSGQPRITTRITPQPCWKSGLLSCRNFTIMLSGDRWTNPRKSEYINKENFLIVWFKMAHCHFCPKFVVRLIVMVESLFWWKITSFSLRIIRNDAARLCLSMLVTLCGHLFELRIISNSISGINVFMSIIQSDSSLLAVTELLQLSI